MHALQRGMDLCTDLLCHPATLLLVALVFAVVVASDIAQS